MYDYKKINDLWDGYLIKFDLKSLLFEQASKTGFLGDTGVAKDDVDLNNARCTPSLDDALICRVNVINPKSPHYHAGRGGVLFNTKTKKWTLDKDHTIIKVFSKAAKEFKNIGILNPIKGGKVGSKVGTNHGGSNERRAGHNGVDIKGVRAQTEVRAVLAGKVVGIIPVNTYVEKLKGFISKVKRKHKWKVEAIKNDYKNILRFKNKKGKTLDARWHVRPKMKAHGDYSLINGVMVVLRHQYGESKIHITTTYLHLDSIDGEISIGKLVTKGQAIGKVGRTGMFDPEDAKISARGHTGVPHLHFIMRVKGKIVDPEKYIKF